VRNDDWDHIPIGHMAAAAADVGKLMVLLCVVALIALSCLRNATERVEAVPGKFVHRPIVKHQKGPHEHVARPR
jgi:hypothetical protein